MKIRNITDIDKFFDTVNNCEGTVEMLTSEGDRLNLKSQLSKYVALAKLFSDGAIKEIEIVCHDPRDIDKLIRYMICK